MSVPELLERCLATSDVDGSGPTLSVQRRGGLWELAEFTLTGAWRTRSVSISGREIDWRSAEVNRRTVVAASQLEALADGAPSLHLPSLPPLCTASTLEVREVLHLPSDPDWVQCPVCEGRRAVGVLPCGLCAATGEVAGAVFVQLTGPGTDVTTMVPVGAGTVPSTAIAEVVVERPPRAWLELDWAAWWDDLLELHGLDHTHLDEPDGAQRWCLVVGDHLCDPAALVPTAPERLMTTDPGALAVAELRRRLRWNPAPVIDHDVVRNSWGAELDLHARVCAHHVTLRPMPTVDELLADLDAVCAPGGFDLLLLTAVGGGCVPAVRLLNPEGYPVVVVAVEHGWQLALLAARDHLLGTSPGMAG